MDWCEEPAQESCCGKEKYFPQPGDVYVVDIGVVASYVFHVGDTVFVSYYCDVESEQGKECRDEIDCPVCGEAYI